MTQDSSGNPRTIRHVVALSGGKDSTAMALRLAEVEPRDYIYACTPTGDELPEMLDHWNRLSELLGSQVIPITGGHSLKGLIRKWESLPNNHQRWCTRVLKIEPFQRFLKENTPVISYVGLRADEEGRAGMQFIEDADVEIRFPMREWGWSETDVWAYLEQGGIQIPARTDCARCYHQTLGEWWRLWHDHPGIYADAVEDEALVSHERGRSHTFRGASRDTWPAGLEKLREQFERGYVPSGAVRTDDFFTGGARRKTMCRICSL